MSSGNVVIVSLLGDWGAALVKATWPTPADGVLGGPKLRLDSRTGLRPTESELGEVRVRTERVGSGWWGGLLLENVHPDLVFAATKCKKNTAHVGLG